VSHPVNAGDRRHELSARELTALKEIALSGQASDHLLARLFLDENIVVDLGEDLLLTNRGRSIGNARLATFVGRHTLIF
jgi:hypothetical protein